MDIETLRGNWWLRLSGVGFSFYRRAERIQEDDRLVRAASLAKLDAALGNVRSCEAAFRAAYIKPLTRENPDQDPLRLEQLARILALRDRIGTLETRIRNAAVPPADAAWNRHRDHTATIARLAKADTDLFGFADLVAEASGAIGKDNVADAADGPLGVSLAGLEAALRERDASLAFHA